MLTLRHAYRTAFQTLALPPGLGDYLRGSIALAHHARERGWRLELDFAGHPIGRFLAQLAPATAPDEPVAEFFDAQATQVYRWMDALTPGSPSRLCTNLLPHPSRIDAGVCALVREQLAFSGPILEGASRLHDQVSDGDFAVVHVRMADEDFHTDRPAAAALLHSLEHDIVPRWGRRVAVLSNNNRVKRALSERFRLPLIDTAAAHLGACEASDETIRDTLVDFALLGRAGTIYSHSAYHWKSGFSHWAATLYGVPYEAIHIPTARASRLKETAKLLRDRCDPGF
jgi:hypothetical protein